MDQKTQSGERPGTSFRPIERTDRAAGGPIDLDLLKRKSWGNVLLENVRLTGPAEYDFALRPLADCLMLLDLHRTDGETAVSGGTRSHRKNLRGRLTFIPSGVELGGWSKTAKPASFSAIYFDERTLREERSDLSLVAPMIEFEDTMLRTTMQQLASVLAEPSLDQPGYVETLAILLTFELGRCRGAFGGSVPAASGLSPWQMKKVSGYIEDSLTPSITELSALLDMSKFHFIRAFKKSFGLPPHRFILRQRIERARELLTDQQLSIAEVAERTGFHSSAALNRAFRQFVGTTPTGFQRSLY